MITWFYDFPWLFKSFPKYNLTSKNTQAQILAVTIAYHIWVKVADQDAGKNTAGLLDPDTLGQCCWSLSELISELYWVIGSFTI